MKIINIHITISESLGFRYGQTEGVTAALPGIFQQFMNKFQIITIYKCKN